MLVRDAVNRWCVSEATVWNYVRFGYIIGLNFEDDLLVIPDIPKPYVARLAPDTALKVDRRIKRVLDKGQYATAASMKITPKLFGQRLRELERSGQIIHIGDSDPDYRSTNGFILAAVGEHPAINISPIIQGNLEVGINGTQIGLLNSQIG